MKRGREGGRESERGGESRWKAGLKERKVKHLAQNSFIAEKYLFFFDLNILWRCHQPAESPCVLIHCCLFCLVGRDVLGLITSLLVEE